MLRKLWNWWISFFNDFNSAQGRDIALAAVTIPPAIIIHLFYLFIFVYWQVWPLAIFNVYSVLHFVGVNFIVLHLDRRRLGYILIAAEIIVHGFLVIHFVGWGFGAQYNLLVNMVTLLLTSAIYSDKAKAGFATFITSIFIFYYYYSELFSPVYSVPPIQLAIINIINIFTAFSFVALAIMYVLYLVNRAEAALALEHEKSEALLNNVLPTVIASRLKDTDETIADDFANASILFADIAGFTPLSVSLSPAQLVNLLDTIFSRFDELVDHYGLEKIKTVGDEYMVASGIPTPREDHAEALAHFALAMRDSLAEFNQHNNTNLQIRIGLNSGPVIAGVIGKRRFLYDLWGDSVNTASRMESHGVPGKIQVSEATRQLLDGKFTFVDRGIIEVKGKGPMQTYLLHANGTVSSKDLVKA